MQQSVPVIGESHIPRAKVLVFGTMGDIAEVAQQSLLRAGYEVEAVAFAQNLLRDESGYRRELVRASQRFDPDFILPAGNNIAPARIKSTWSLRPLIITDAAEKVEMLDSKLSASRLAAELCIPQPRFFDSADEVPSYPVIFKRDVSFAGSGVYKPSSREALERITEHFAGHPYLIEEYIEGSDWSVDAIHWDGYFRCSSYRTLTHHGQGPSTTRELVRRPDLESYARMLLDAVDYHGVCGIDFRIAPDGRPFFLECNPRLTGGLSTQIEGGFDIPEELLRLSRTGMQ